MKEQISSQTEGNTFTVTFKGVGKVTFTRINPVTAELAHSAQTTHLPPGYSISSIVLDMPEDRFWAKSTERKTIEAFNKKSPKEQAEIMHDAVRRAFRAVGLENPDMEMVTTDTKPELSWGTWIGLGTMQRFEQILNKDNDCSVSFVSVVASRMRIECEPKRSL